MSENENVKKAGFFTNLKSEFKRCTWPKKEDLAKQSVLVIVVSIVLGLVIVGIDWGIREGLNLLGIVG